MLKIGLACLTLVLSLAPGAFSQGSGSMAEPGKNDSAFHVSKSIKAKVVELRDDEKLVVEEQETKLTLNVNEDTKILAEEGADVRNSNRPVLGDIKKGHVLRVTYHPDTNDAIEIRILREKG